MKRLTRDIVAEFLLYVGFTDTVRIDPRKLFIATFHRVLPEECRREYPFPGLVVTPQEFLWFISYFRQSFDCCTLSEACSKWRSGERRSRPLLAITFDDGQLDNLVYAVPVLDDAGIRGTFFVTVQGARQGTPLWHDRIAYSVLGLRGKGIDDVLTSYGLARVPSTGATGAFAREIVQQAKGLATGTLARFLRDLDQIGCGASLPSWDGLMDFSQMRQLIRAGHEIGCHTASHAVLPNCTDDELKFEVAGARSMLREELGAKIGSFCYPNGSCDQRTCEAVRRAGFAQAVVTSPGPNIATADPYRLRRFDMVAVHVRDRRGRLSRARLAWRMSDLYPWSLVR